MINIRYVGRRSGRTIETPVGYRRTSDGVVINVMSPDNKTWWRNFLGDGGEITLLKFDGHDHTGHADRSPRRRRARIGGRRSTRDQASNLTCACTKVPAASRMRLITRIAVASTLICGGTAALTAALT